MDYHDLYLKSDVLILADVFENFRKNGKEYYNLDPAHYFSCPGFAWGAMLKMTDINLELITAIDMYQMVETGLRGGVSYIANRYSKPNNKYLSDYDKNKDRSYLMYLDANNHYGWAMSQPLPTGRFKWLKEDKWDEILKNKEGIGYFIECDLEYPPKIHYLHNNYPLAPEKLIVQDDWLSPFCKNLKEKFGLASYKTTKLIPTLFNKEKYVLHIRNLSLYKDLSMKLTKIYRVLQFNESPWLVKYIDFNINKRSNAKNAFEKDFFKLINNTVFGKTLENLRKRKNLKLTSNEDIYIQNMHQEPILYPVKCSMKIYLQLIE